MLSLSSQLKDYRIAYFINEYLGVELEKYEDFYQEKARSFSWYCYAEGENGATFYLVGNHHPAGKLIPSMQNIDYFLLIKDLYDEQRLADMMRSLRSIPGVMAVFQPDMASVKNLDVIIENLELHELEKVIKPGRTGMRAR